MEKLSKTIAKRSIDLTTTQIILIWTNGKTQRDYEYLSWTLYRTEKGSNILLDRNGYYILLTDEEAWDHLLEYDEDTQEFADLYQIKLNLL